MGSKHGSSLSPHCWDPSHVLNEMDADFESCLTAASILPSGDWPYS